MNLWDQLLKVLRRPAPPHIEGQLELFVDGVNVDARERQDGDAPQRHCDQAGRSVCAPSPPVLRRVK